MRFSFRVSQNPVGWVADAYLVNGAALEPFWAASGSGSSPGAAIDAAESAARKELEALLGAWEQTE